MALLIALALSLCTVPAQQTKLLPDIFTEPSAIIAGGQSANQPAQVNLRDFMARNRADIGKWTELWRDLLGPSTAAGPQQQAALEKQVSAMAETIAAVGAVSPPAEAAGRGVLEDAMRIIRESAGEKSATRSSPGTMGDVANSDLSTGAKASNVVVVMAPAHSIPHDVMKWFKANEKPRDRLFFEGQHRYVGVVLAIMHARENS